MLTTTTRKSSVPTKKSAVPTTPAQAPEAQVTPEVKIKKINRLQTAELETAKQVYNDQLSTLEAYHRAALVSHGEYQVKKLQLAEEADAKSLGTLERSRQAIEEKFKLEQNALKKS